MEAIETKNGIYQTFHTNGKPYEAANYKDGKLHGSYKVWYDSGQRFEERTYENGVKMVLC